MPKKILILLLKIILILVGLIAMYLIFAFTLPLISVNSDHKQPEQGVKIFVLSNGVHTDIAVPVKSKYRDWTTSFPKDSFHVSNDLHSFLGFGWGDKGFYLYTPEWSDLKASTALKAVSGLGGTAMHVTYLKEKTKESEKCRIFNITPEEYKKLTAYIEESFVRENDKFIKIDHPGYGNNDRFYEAKGKYSLFKTCNTWTNRGLKNSGLKTGLWTPFSKGLMSSIKH